VSNSVLTWKDFVKVEANNKEEEKGESAHVQEICERVVLVNSVVVFPSNSDSWALENCHWSGSKLQSCRRQDRSQNLHVLADALVTYDCVNEVCTEVEHCGEDW